MSLTKAETAAIISQVGALIGDIDRNLAQVFINKPFHRKTALTALVAGCQGTRFEDLSFRIYAAGMKAVEAVR